MTLSKKASTVAATDSYIAANSGAVDNALDRVRASSSYQDVVRLQSEQGGQPAATSFEQNFAQSFQKDLKTDMSVDRIDDPKPGAD